MIALAHERLSPHAGTPLSDQELSEIVQETRIDLSIWLKYSLETNKYIRSMADRAIAIG